MYLYEFLKYLAFLHTSHFYFFCGLNNCERATSRAAACRCCYAIRSGCFANWRTCSSPAVYQVNLVIIKRNHCKSLSKKSCIINNATYYVLTQLILTILPSDPAANFVPAGQVHVVVLPVVVQVGAVDEAGVELPVPPIT